MIYPDLTDPLFSAREAAKQLVLLEDHLACPGKQCPDCISKHRLAAEAFADECLTLGGQDPRLASLPAAIRHAQDGQAIRSVRKDLTSLLRENGMAGFVPHPEVYGTLHGFDLAGMIGMGRLRGPGIDSPEEPLCDMNGGNCVYAGNNVPVPESRPEPGKPAAVLPGYVPKLPSDPHTLTWDDKAKASSAGWGQFQAFSEKNGALVAALLLFAAWKFLR